MRLLNAETYELEEFLNPGNIPKYAILSHTWGSAKDEVLYKDIADLEGARLKAGFAKVRWTCEQAMKDGLQYAWIDTCCIDKSSSAELSEAINSMYQWYRESTVCYALLEDVEEVVTQTGYRTLEMWQLDESQKQFFASRWFTRGWTLQELLAPKAMVFYGSGWIDLGSVELLVSLICLSTRIPMRFVLKRSDVAHVSVAQRMSWAAYRKTTRPEDVAYCLLGLFGVNMPLLYGEGDRAFLRLQHSIAAVSVDQSLLAWDRRPSKRYDKPTSVFASSPSDFAGCGHIAREVYTTDSPEHGATVTSDGVRLKVTVLPSPVLGYDVAVLNCFDDRLANVSIALLLHKVDFDRNSTVDDPKERLKAALGARPLKRGIYFITARTVVTGRSPSSSTKTITLSSGVTTSRTEHRLLITLPWLASQQMCHESGAQRWSVLAADPAELWLPHNSSFVVPQASGNYTEIKLHLLLSLNVPGLEPVTGRIHIFMIMPLSDGSTYGRIGARIQDDDQDTALASLDSDIEYADRYCSLDLNDEWYIRCSMLEPDIAKQSPACVWVHLEKRRDRPGSSPRLGGILNARTLQKITDALANAVACCFLVAPLLVVYVIIYFADPWVRSLWSVRAILRFKHNLTNVGDMLPCSQKPQDWHPTLERELNRAFQIGDNHG